MNGSIEVSNKISESLDSKFLISAERCPVCGGRSKQLLDIPTINPNSNDRVALMECKDCIHWWHNPLVNQKYLLNLYAADSEFVVSLKGLPKLGEPSDIEIQRMAQPILKDFSKKEKFNYLEVGSSSGHLLDYFSKFAKITYGVEPSRLEDKSNVVPDIDDLPEGIKFDCVVIQDVLEHVTDPGDMLKKIRSKMNPGGLIYAGFPNKDCLKAKIMKNEWGMMRPIGHLHYFSSKSIDLLFSKSGWKVIKKRSARIGDTSAWEIIKGFNYRIASLPYRFVKSLLLGQLILGKDQWKIKAVVK